MVQLKDGRYTGVGKGYHGDINVEVEIKDNKMTGVDIISHQDQHGIADVGVERLPAIIIENQTYNVDTVTGASVTSQGIKEAVRDALKNAGSDESTFGHYVDTSVEVMRSSLEQNKALNPEEVEWAETYDVVVIGAGAAGMAAAIEARRKEASVAIIEYAPNHLFSNTALSEGIVMASESSVLKEAGYDDSNAEFRKFVDAITAEGTDPELMAVWVEESGDMIEFLIECGVEFPADKLDIHNEELYTHVTEAIPRGHNTPNVTGVELADPVYQTCVELGVDFYFETTAEKLITDTTHRVIGVATNKGNFKANKGVVVATAGFTRNRDLIEQFMPGTIVAESSGSIRQNGDGIIMGMDIGAKIGGMWNPMFTTSVYQTGENEFPVYMADGPNILVGADGKRHFNEVTLSEYEYQNLGWNIVKQPNHFVWNIWDQEVTDKATEGQELGIFSSTMEQEGFSHNYEEEIEAGYIKKGETLEELAQEIDVDPATLVETVERFNELARNGTDADFGRNMFLAEVQKAPFYALKVVPTAPDSAGGLVINTKAEVLDLDNKPISGLYAAGSTTTGWTGRYYPGSGTAISTAFVFGRIAGQNVAE